MLPSLLLLLPKWSTEFIKALNLQKNREALYQFLLPLDIIDFNVKAASEYGNIRAVLEEKGKPIGAMDILIAAHARSLGITLVTNNVKEFKRVKNLRIVNWVL